MLGLPLRETFQPIPVKPPEDNRLFFILRCLIDLQLLTIHRFLSSHLTNVSGRILDVGAGQAPWKGLLPAAAKYVGVDVYSAGDFGMSQLGEVVFYDGVTLPFDVAEFDNAMCIEVLEHVPEPVAFLCEISRVMKPGAQLFLTVPWAARVHHMPHDYHRFTRFRLLALLEASGFDVISLTERGNDIAVVANKIIVIQLRLLKAHGNPLGLLWRWPVALILAPVSVAFIMAAHVTMACGGGSAADPLGYAAMARKRLASAPKTILNGGAI